MKPATELIDEDNDAVAETWQDSPVATASRYPKLARFGAALAGVVVLVVATVALVPLVLPASVTAPYTEKFLSDFFGMSISIEGDHSISFLPSLQVEATDIVAVPEGTVSDFRISSFRATASTFSLMSGSLDIAALHVHEPHISLLPGQKTSDTPVNSEEINRTWGWWRDFQMKAFTVSGGTLTIMSSDVTDDIVLTDISISDVPPGADEAADGIAFDGKASANGQEVALHVAASDPQLFVSGNRWPVTGLVSSTFMSLGFNGSLAMREHLVGDGNIQLSSGDISALNRWLGTRLPARENDRLDVTTSFELSANTLEMKGIKISAGATAADGMVKLTGLAAGQPQLEMSIDGDTIDFGHTPLSDLVQDGATIPVLPVPGIISLSWKKALWGEMELGIGDASIERTTENGALTVKLNKVLALDGIFRGEMTLSNSEGMRALHFDGTAVGVSFENLVAQSEPSSGSLISGAASMDVTLFSVGGNSEQLFEALSGSAKLQVQNGILTFPALVEGLNQNDGSAINFASLNGAFDVAQGIATSNDLLLRADDISLVGQGSIDMADWTIDLDIGQLKTDDGEKSLQRYRVSGPVRAVQVEAIN